jgi:hypothetical protein
VIVEEHMTALISTNETAANMTAEEDALTEEDKLKDESLNGEDDDV